MDIIYDLAKKRFLDSSGLTRNGFTPTLAYGEKPIWKIELVDTSRNDGTPDVSRVSAWRSAIDTDFRTATSPMCRTTEGIVQAQGIFGVAVLVPIDSATERYLEVCDGRRSTACWFELAGLDAAGDTVFYVSFPISALFPIDPSASGDVVPVEVTDLTRTQVEAIAKAASSDALAAGISSEVASQVTPAVTAALADYKPLPPDGTAGQVLTKTEDGAVWKTLDIPDASVLAWGAITGTLSDQSDLQAVLDSKITGPSAGEEGAYLQKTATGVQWAAIATGGASSQVVRTITSLDAFNALTQEVKESKESIAFLAIPGKNGAEWSAQDGNVKPSHCYLATPLLDDCLILDLTALGSYYAIPTATTEATLEISPGQRLVWTLEADSTLSAKAINETHWATAQIEISTGSHNVTAGSNMTIVDTLTANAVNVCEVRWRAGAARLRVVDVISAGGDTPQPTPTITAPPSQSVEGKQGEEMTASIVTGVSASNGASVSFAVKQGSALPAGLALSSAGDVTGTPTAAGSTTTTVVLSADGCDSVEMTVTLNIAESIQQGTITVTTNPTIQGVVGTAITSYNLASCVTVSNGQTPSFRWNDVYSPQPSWLTLTTSGMLSGTPTSIPSPTTGKVLVSADKCSNEPNINITWDIIDAGTIAVDSQTISGTVGNAVSLNLRNSTTVSNGQTPTFAVKSGNTLPAGIELSSAGVLSGTPTATSSATVVVTITARGCPTKDVNITFDITEAPSVSDGFPKSFNVTSVPVASGYAQKPIGSYARTGETLVLGDVAYPVYSHTSDAVTGDQKTFYIHICNQMMGSTGVYWALSYEKPTSAEVEGYTHPRLGCVELKSGTYEPQGKNWGGADGTCEVEWTM